MLGPDIEIPDIERVLIGEAPWLFLVEAAVRGVLLYIILITAMRLMGKRMAGSLSLSDLAIIVTLGAVSGVPMLTPERGMLPSVLLLAVAVAIERGLSLLAFKSRAVEVATRGDVNLLVRDGELLLAEIRRASLSRERLFATLREQGVTHLGQVRRAYLETNGKVSLFRFDRSRPGLSIMPAFDAAWHAAEDVCDDRRACGRCGRVADRTPEAACPNCHGDAWHPAVRGQREG
jgi:uncharacterized membrane protein YcaP (DUF421 family)